MKVNQIKKRNPGGGSEPHLIRNPDRNSEPDNNRKPGGQSEPR